MISKRLGVLLLSLILVLFLSFNVYASPVDEIENNNNDEFTDEYEDSFDVDTIFNTSFDEDYDQDDQHNPEPTILRGVITYVGPFEEAESDVFYLGRQDFSVRVTTKGDFYGEVFELDNLKTGHPLYDLDLKVGQRVLLYSEIEDGEIVNIGLQSYARDFYLYILIAIFIFVLVLVGGFKGVKALITLIIMGVLIVLGVLPQLLKGYNPLMLAIVFSSIIAVITLFIVGGISNKSLAAIGGVIGGLVVAGILAVIFGNVAHLTGFSSEEAQMLQFVDESIKINMSGLLFAGIIIGTLGAVLDVGMSTASSMAELKNSVPDISSGNLFKAGMNVGRDVMGTMVNTLILAYTGSSLPLLLIFRAYETPYNRIINMDLIATEVVRSLVGSLGLILAIPLTAACFILLTYRKK